MDRIDAMRVFVTALEEGSLAAAGRRLGHSPSAISRAVALLEGHVGTPLLHRTTRSLRLSEAGERYAAACRRILTDLEEADLTAAGERTAPRGMLTITAPLTSGRMLVRPLLEEFLDRHPQVRARLLLLDRPVSLVEEGIDVGLRFAHLPDSSLIAVRVGEVRRVLCAAPSYLAKAPRLTSLSDLPQHRLIALEQQGRESWTFGPAQPGGAPRVVQITPQLSIIGVEGVVDAAIDGFGIARLYSSHVAAAVRAGQLRILLPEAEPPPLPVHLLTPEGRLALPKVRAFVDFAVPRLRSALAGLTLAGSDIP